MDREDMKHHFTLLITEGRLHLAPIGPSPETILDVGTGTGMSNTKYVTLMLKIPRDLGYRYGSVLLILHHTYSIILI